MTTHKPMTTAYVISNSGSKTVYYLPRMDQWLTIENVQNKYFTGTVVELRSARQSEIRMAEGKPKIKIPSYQTYRCVRDTLNVGIEIMESGYSITEGKAW